jgi:hypothetical protein
MVRGTPRLQEQRSKAMKIAIIGDTGLIGSKWPRCFGCVFDDRLGRAASQRRHTAVIFREGGDPVHRGLSIQSRLSPDRHCEPPGRANARPMTGSAKQIHSAANGEVDCFAALAMTAERAFAISRRIAPEVCISFGPPEFRGRREDRVLAAPAVPRAICANKTAHEHTGQREHSGLPCAMALRLTSCSPRRTALLPPSPREKLCLSRT